MSSSMHTETSIEQIIRCIKEVMNIPHLVILINIQHALHQQQANHNKFTEKRKKKKVKLRRIFQRT